MLVSSTEPKGFHALGKLSTIPEVWGVDFLWWVPRIKSYAGVQRKEVKDFIASAQDGRLVKEVAQMQELGMAWLVLEGEVQWFNGAVVVNQWCQMPREHYLGVMLAVQQAGIRMLQSESIPATVEVVRWLEGYSRKERHTALTAKPSPPVNKWGGRGSRDYGLWILQSLSGVGPELAGRIYDHFGEVPMKWTVGVEELMKVKGVGREKAKAMLKALSNESS